MPFDTAQNVLSNETVDEAVRRNIISVTDQRVTYRLNQQRTYDWTDPEEWVRAHTIAWLVIKRDYPTNRIKTEVVVPRRTPHDFADVVPEFVQTLLRTRYYQRAFRAITTGHSNRRRTQIADFEAIELTFLPEPGEQRRLIAGITDASGGIRAADEALRRELHAFSSVVDGRGDEELPEIDEEATIVGRE